VYHADCFTDVREAYGQFVVEASIMPQHLDEFFGEVARLLRRQAELADPVDLERARNQLTVRTLFVQEAPEEQLERAAADLLALGRMRSQEVLLADIGAVGGDRVSAAFRQMLEAGAAVGLAGKVARDAEKRIARVAEFFARAS
jgi:predicted Zn-dependent peptidase